VTPGIRRPVLRYYGGGWNRAKWTVSHMPAHVAYCEPCFGSGAVLLRKPASKLEIANDIDGRVVNFFDILRAQPEELAHAIHLTPWHEAEYRRSLTPSLDPLEDAWRFFFTAWASVKGGPIPGSSDFRWQKVDARYSAAVKDTANLSHLLAAADRLKNVQFLCRDGLSVITKMAGTGALIYFDRRIWLVRALARPVAICSSRARSGMRLRPSCCGRTMDPCWWPATGPRFTTTCTRSTAGRGWSGCSRPTAVVRPWSVCGCRQHYPPCRCNPD